MLIFLLDCAFLLACGSPYILYIETFLYALSLFTCLLILFSFVMLKLFMLTSDLLSIYSCIFFLHVFCLKYFLPQIKTRKPALSSFPQQIAQLLSSSKFKVQDPEDIPLQPSGNCPFSVLYSYLMILSAFVGSNVQAAFRLLKFLHDSIQL